MLAIVMSHGFSATRDMKVPGFAERPGSRCWCSIIASWATATGCIAEQPGIDAARIGLWGTSYSGGHALFVGALDPRIKVIVAQVPALAVAA